MANNYEGLKHLNDAFLEKGTQYGNDIVAGYKQLMMSGATADDLQVFAQATGYAPIRRLGDGQQEDLTDYFSHRSPRTVMEGAQDLAASFGRGALDFLSLGAQTMGAARDVVGTGGEAWYETSAAIQQKVGEYLPYANEYRVSRQRNIGMGEWDPTGVGQGMGSMFSMAGAGAEVLAAKAVGKFAAKKVGADALLKYAAKKLPTRLVTASKAIGRGVSEVAGTPFEQASVMTMAGQGGQQAYEYQKAQAEAAGGVYGATEEERRAMQSQRLLPITMGAIAGTTERWSSEALVTRLAPKMAPKVTRALGGGKRPKLIRAKDIPGFVPTVLKEVGKEFGQEEVEAALETVGESSYMKGSIIERYANKQAQLINTVPLATLPFGIMAGFKSSAMKGRALALEEMFPGQKSLFRINGADVKPLAVTTLSYESMTPEQRAVVQQQVLTTGVAWDFTSAKNSELDEAARELSTAGVRVQYVAPAANADAVTKDMKAKPGQITAGQANGHLGWYDAQTGTVYVNSEVSPEMQLVFIKSHELVHDLRRQFKGSIDQLRDYFVNTFGDEYLNFEKGNFGPGSAYEKQIKKDNPKAAPATVQDLLTEEAFTNFVTNHMAGYLAVSMMSPNGLQKIYEQSPGLFGDIADVWSSWSAQITGGNKLSPYQQQMALRVLEEAKGFEEAFTIEATAQVPGAVAPRQVGGATQTGEAGVRTAVEAVNRFQSALRDLLDMRIGQMEVIETLSKSGRTEDEIAKELVASHKVPDVKQAKALIERARRTGRLTAAAPTTTPTPAAGAAPAAGATTAAAPTPASTPGTAGTPAAGAAAPTPTPTPTGAATEAAAPAAATAPTTAPTPTPATEEPAAGAAPQATPEQQKRGQILRDAIGQLEGLLPEYARGNRQMWADQDPELSAASDEQIVAAIQDLISQYQQELDAIPGGETMRAFVPERKTRDVTSSVYDAADASAWQSVADQLERMKNFTTKDQHARIDGLVESIRANAVAPEATAEGFKRPKSIDLPAWASDMLRMHMPALLDQQQDPAVKASLKRITATLPPKLANARNINKPAFKKWFGQSQVTDKYGQPLEVYHGGEVVPESFDPEKASVQGYFGAGFYFSDSMADAKGYAKIRGKQAADAGKGSTSGKVTKAYLSIQNPVVIGQAASDMAFDVRDRSAQNLEQARAEWPVSELGPWPGDQAYLDSLTNPQIRGTTFSQSEALGFVDAWERHVGDLVKQSNEDAMARRLTTINTRKVAEAANSMREWIKATVGRRGEVPADLINNYLDGVNLGGAQKAMGSAATGITMVDAGQQMAKEAMRRAFEGMGYDGIILPAPSRYIATRQAATANTHYIAFKPTQIKASTGNAGTFDPNDPRILRALVPLGSSPEAEALVQEIEQRVSSEVKPGQAPAGTAGRRDVKGQQTDANNILDANFQPSINRVIELAKTDPKVAQLLKSIAAAVKDSHEFRFIPRSELAGKTPEQVVQVAVRHMADNLERLFLAMDPTARRAAMRWYEGANIIANRWADRYGLTVEQIGTVLASLSPQKDWYQNVSLAERVLDMAVNPDQVMVDAKTEAALDGLKQFMRDEAAKAERWIRKNYIPGLTSKRKQSTRDAYRAKNESQVSQKRGIIAKRNADAQRVDRLRADLAGKSLREIMDMRDKAQTIEQLDDANYAVAMVAKCWDLSHNSSTYARSRPDGMLWAASKRRIAWTPNNFILKALVAASTQSRDELSRLLGNENKVRSFGANIIDPNGDFGAVTVDTHAVAAALLQPLSGKDEIVSRVLMGPPASGTLGMSGLYALLRESYVVAAQRQGVQPRQMQSVTWEMVRALFSEAKSGKNAVAIKAQLDTVVDNAASLGGEETFNRIVELAGGVKNPDWLDAAVGRKHGFFDPAEASTYDGPLVAGDLSRPEQSLDDGADGASDGELESLRAFVPGQPPELESEQVRQTLSEMQRRVQAGEQAGDRVQPGQRLISFQMLEQMYDPDIGMPARQMTPAVKAWNRDNKLVDGAGKPLTWAHAQPSKYRSGAKAGSETVEIQKWTAFTHFGTPSAASFRVNQIRTGTSLGHLQRLHGDVKEIADAYPQSGSSEISSVLSKALSYANRIDWSRARLEDAMSLVSKGKVNLYGELYREYVETRKAYSQFLEDNSSLLEYTSESIPVVGLTQAAFEKLIGPNGEVLKDNSAIKKLSPDAMAWLREFRRADIGTVSEAKTYPVVVKMTNPVLLSDDEANGFDPIGPILMPAWLPVKAAVMNDALEALSTRLSDSGDVNQSRAVSEARDRYKLRVAGLAEYKANKMTAGIDRKFEEKFAQSAYDMTADMLSWPSAPSIHEYVVHRHNDLSSALAVYGKIDTLEEFKRTALTAVTEEKAKSDQYGGRGIVTDMVMRMYPTAAGTAALLESGFDGILYTNAVEDRNSISAMTLVPGQARNAINLANGESDSTDPEVMRSFLPDPRPWFSSGIDKSNPLDFTQMDDPSMGYAIKMIGDNLMPPRAVQKAIEQQAKSGKATYDESMDFSARADMHKAQLAKMLEHVSTYLNAIKKALAEGDIPLDAEGAAKRGKNEVSAEEYLYARHAKQRNKVLWEEDLEADDVYAAAKLIGDTAAMNARMADMISRDPKLLSQSGMTNAQADDILRRAAASGKIKHYVAISDANKALQSRKLQIAVQFGLMSQYQADAWKAKYGPDYVPLKTTKLDPGEVHFGASGFSVRGRESQRARGRRSLADDLMGFAAMDFGAIASRAVRNRVGQAFFSLLEANPNPSWTFYKSRSQVAVKDLERLVVVKFDGKERYVVIHNAEIVKSIRNLDSQSLSTFTAWTAGVTRQFTRLNTQWSPAFIPTNFLRDAGLGLFFTWVDDGLPALKAMAKHMPSATRTVFQMAFKRPITNPTMAKYYQEMDNEGGFTKYATYFGVAEAMAELNQAVDLASGKGKLGKLGTAVDKITPEALKGASSAVLRVLEGLGEVSERSTRLAKYAQERENGASALKAAEAAKNLTVNFERRGNASASLNVLYTFFNARAQSTSNFARRMPWADYRTKEQKQRMIGGMATMMAMGFIASYVARQAAGDDDEGENAMEGAPKHDLKNNIVFPPVGGFFPTVPLPYGLNVFHFIGTQLDRMMAGFDTPEDAAGNIIESVFTNAMPIDGPSFAQFVAPTIADPFVQIATNEDFKGQKIYPDRNPYDKTPVPDSQLAFRTVNPVLKAAAEALNELGGGSARRPAKVEALDISPESMEHVLRFAGGGAGDYLFSAVDGFMKLFAQEPMRLRDVPLAGPIAARFARQVDPAQRTKTEFYENMGNMAWYREDVLDPETQAEARASRLGALDMMATETEKQLNDLRALQKTARTEESRQRLDAKMVELMRRFNRRYNALKRKVAESRR